MRLDISSIAKRIASGHPLRVALAPSQVSDEEIRELAEMPEYANFESFVQETLDEMDDSFNLSDVKILSWSFYSQWVKAGKPDVDDPNVEIKPMNNRQIIDVLTKEWGLKYDTSTSAPQPKQISERSIPGKIREKPRSFDRKSRLVT